MFPLAPFRKEDPFFGARGRLLARLRTPGSPLPDGLEQYRERLIRDLENELREGNLYWPTSPEALVQQNWSWLLGQQRASERN